MSLFFHRKIFAVITVFVVLFVPVTGLSQTAGESESIILSAENLFSAMKAKNYTEIWRYLTQKSQKEICENVIKAATKQKEKLTFEQVLNDFSQGGVLAQAYWNAYLDVFNPDMVLKESTWKLEEVGKKEATIALQHKKAERPARLQMKKEDGLWKVGLEESFGILRWLVK